ncbi:hypothetical protein ACFL0D_01715 [Thermoproteota archaeon]
MLDGVISRKGDGSLDELITNMILNSKHLGQVRVILVDESYMPESVDPFAIWEGTGKPVLVLKREDSLDLRYMFRYDEQVVLAVGLDEGSARRVMDRVHGSMGSRALSLADNILRGLPELHNV